MLFCPIIIIIIYNNTAVLKRERERERERESDLGEEDAAPERNAVFCTDLASKRLNIPLLILFCHYY